MKKVKLTTLFTLSLSALLIISGCAKRESFRASKAFYINDQAEALLSSTEYLIYDTSLNLYENTSKTSEAQERKISGAQVVVATALSPLDSLPSTDIFNSWGIGDNDMGLFLLLYFAEGEEGYFPTYLGMNIEIGAQMAGHISMTHLLDIRSETWDTSGLYSDDYETKLVTFYLALIEEISSKVYGNTSFSSSNLLDWYEENKYENYFNYVPRGLVAENTLSWWVITLIVLGVFVLSGSSGALGIFFTNKGGSSHKGGGGTSRGYKVTR